MIQKINIHKRNIFIYALVFLLLALMVPHYVYAKVKERVYVEDKLQLWMTVGDTVQFTEKRVREVCGVKSSKSKVTFSTDSNGCLKVTKNGLVSVKKPKKDWKNYKKGIVNATFTYKNIEYTYSRVITVAYEYDDNKPISGDVTPEQIKKFKQAYKTGKTNQLDKTEKKIFKKVKQAVDYSKNGKNRYEKLKLLNDWITKNANYDYSFAKTSFHIEGPFLYGKAVCQGYTNAFKLCSLVMDIPCENVLGRLKYNPLEGHEWNIVKMEDGKWYHIDVTFNDTGSKKKFSNTDINDFCLTDKQMRANGHIWYDAKKCNGKKYNITYYEKDYFVDTEAEWYNAVKSAVSDNKEYVFFYVDNSNAYLHETLDTQVLDPNMQDKDRLASYYVGKNIMIDYVSSDKESADIVVDESINGVVVPASICPNNKEHVMELYKITYLSDEEVEPIKFISNDAQMEQVMRDAVAKGDTIIYNVAVAEDYDYDNIFSEESVIRMFGRNIVFAIGGGIPIPEGCTQDGKVYMGTQIDVVYENDN